MKPEKVKNIRTSRRHVVWLLPLFALLVLLLGLIADGWLESPGGRQLLQSELSQRLGLPVVLRGEYGLKFLPRLKIAGKNLELGQRYGEGSLIYSRNFFAEVELLPLFRQELRIVAIGLSDGSIDLAQLSGPEKENDREAISQAGKSISLPDVASLNLSKFSIRSGGDTDRVELDELQLTGFRADVPSDLVIKARMFQGESLRVAAVMAGKLTVEAGDLSSGLRISELQLTLGETLFTGLSGDWRWERSAASLQGSLEWTDPVGSAGLQLELALGSPLSGTLRVNYRNPKFAGPVALESVFTFLAEAVDLEQVKISLGEQAIGGSGCLRFTDKPGLHLSLLADELNLDELQPIFSFGPDSEGELPLGLAIRVQAQSARITGAVADDVLLEIGAEPDCVAAVSDGP